jgi:hypothetical protein
MKTKKLLNLKIDEEKLDAIKNMKEKLHEFIGLQKKSKPYQLQQTNFGIRYIQ